MIAEFLLSQVISLFDPSNYRDKTKPIPPAQSASSPVQSQPKDSQPKESK
jgi:hypothetical protein